MKLIITKEEVLSREGNIEKWYWVDAKDGGSMVGAFSKKCFIKLEEAEKYSNAAEQYYAKHGTFSPHVEFIQEKEIHFITKPIQTT